ncbi:MAG TPA: AMP-binding protein [Solirubrobacteraceae bacterium]|nr:AMP-binding protein [Solirubrobacteraceae bacterium]
MTESVLKADTATGRLRSARDFLLENREDYDTAYREFRWPALQAFNWALDWFDAVASRVGDRPALWIVEEDGSEVRRSFAELSSRSNQVANWLREHGVQRGDRVIVMLGNQVELWETILAAMKLGAVIIPSTPLLGPSDLVDRVERGEARHVVVSSSDAPKFDEVPGDYTRIAVGGPVTGWLSYGDSEGAASGFVPDGQTQASDTLLLYFTSGTTAKPKLVEHSHASYPVGHLSTMYWTGIQPGDVHLNVSSPGWAKHAWSNVYAPWLAEATVMVFNFTRFNARTLLDQMVRCGVSTFCAPPTVWRMLIQEDLGRWQMPLREALAAGEPLNPEVIERVREQWGITVRDGYGQTETTAIIGNTPGQWLKPGSMGRPLPGYAVDLLDLADGNPAPEGEIVVDLAERPLGLMTGYRHGPEQAAAATDGPHYHTGDVASRDGDGYITYVGRTDDVFKASDYRISPFELESVLIEHEAVAEAAVIPSPDPVRLSVPKAYVTLSRGYEPTRETALAIMRFTRERLAPYKRIRRLEFGELPKTISGKIRRVELREDEKERLSGASRPTQASTLEFWEEDFPELKR